MIGGGVRCRGRRGRALLAALALAATACGGADDTEPSAAGVVEASPSASPGEAGPGSEPTAGSPPGAGGADPTAPAPTDAGTGDPGVPATPAPVPTALPVGPVAVPDDLSLSLELVAEVPLPVTIASRAGSDALYVATKDGSVIALELDGSERARVLDLSGRISQGDEQGLLGMAFSTSGDRLFVSYTDPDGDSVIGEYPMDGETADVEAGRVLLTQDQPGEYHNGGHIELGPDGMLWIGFGDGHSDASANAQNPMNLLGSIVRIDPDGGDPYGVPADNPFVERGGAPEVFLYGVRNPWGFAFDRATGDLWIADVGLSTAEEITVVYASEGLGAGGNLGWPLVEGNVPMFGPGPPATGYVAPQYVYGREDGCSITGGRVYRGSAIDPLYGIYVFSDFCSSKLWGFASSEEQGPLGRFDLGVGYEYGVSTFGEGPDGELYVGSFTNEVHRLVPG